MEEIWKSVEDYPDYMVSNLGNVKSIKGRYGYGCLLKQSILSNGYCVVTLCNYYGKKNVSVHRIVAKAFIENPHNHPQVNHINEIKTCNTMSNLEWCSSSYNLTYGNRSKKAIINRVVSVTQYTDDGVVKVWDSISDCGRDGFHMAHIISCCKGRRKTHKKFKWRYTNDR